MRPIFVYGIGRSGTSALLRALGEHPDFDASSASGEAPFIGRFIEFLDEFEVNSPVHEYNVANYKLDEASRSRVFARMLAALHCSPERKKDPKRFWTSKVSFNARSVDRLETIFPRFGLLYIVRNGVEVVNSASKFSGFQSMSFEQLCVRWVGSARQTRFAEARSDVAMMRHEDLIADPHRVLGDAFRKLNVPASDRPAEFIATNVFNSSFSPTERDGDASVARDTLADRRAGAWEAWTDEERSTFLRVCEDEMRRLGFEVPGVFDGTEWSQPVPNRPARQFEPLPEVTDVSRADPVRVPDAFAEARASAEPLRGELHKRVRLAIANYCIHPAPEAGLVYVEVPKVACSTIKHLVQNAELRARNEEPRAFDRMLVHRRRESPLPEIKDMDDATLENMLRVEGGPLRFTVVRDPYDRTLSCYLSKIAVPRMPQRRQIIAALDGGDPQTVEDDGREIDFATFLEVVASQPVRDMDIHWRPQVDQALIGLVKYDFIGRFERLNEALGYVKHRVGSSFDARVPRATNATGSADRTKDYYDARTIELVRRIYADDFEAFGYDADRQLAA